MTTLYSRSLAYVVDNDSDSFTPGSQDNPNLCYIARLDTNFLMFMVRVYKDK